MNDNFVNLNLLYDTEFIKGTIKIQEKEDNINQIIHSQIDIGSKQINENTEPEPFNYGRLDNQQEINNDEPMDTTQNDCSECESQLKQRNIEYENIKKN